MAPTGRATPRLSSLSLSRHNGHGRACRRPTRLGRALLGGTLPVRFPLRYMTTIIQLRAPSNPPSVAASMPAARAASVCNFIIDQTPGLIFLRSAYEAGGGAPPPPNVVVSSSTANLPAASGSRSPPARRARSGEGGDES